MKNLAKKILAPAAIGLASLLPVSGFAKDKQDDFKPKTHLSVGIGAYQGSEQSMQDVYGTIPRLRGSFAREMSRNVSLEGALAFLKKDGTPYLYGDIDNVSGSAEVQMIQLEALVKYVFGKKGARFYIGGGLTYIDFNEKLTLTAYIDGDYISESAEFNESAAGAVLLLGVNLPINQKETTFFYAELSGRSANINTDFGTQVDVGGGIIEGGIRFTIGD